MEATGTNEPLQQRLIEEIWGQADELLKHDGIPHDIPAWGECKVAEYKVIELERIEDLSAFVLDELADEQNPKLVVNRKNSRRELSLTLDYYHEEEGPSELRISLKKDQLPLFEHARKQVPGRIRKVDSSEATHENLNDFLLILTSPNLTYLGQQEA